MTAPEVREAISDLLSNYVALLDRDDYDKWLEHFTDDCIYKVVPRENIDQGLPGIIVLCENKKMLVDRIVSLREANEYNLHTPRHLISNIRIVGEEHGVYAVETNYAVYQSNLEGETRLFSVGSYDDRVVFENGTPRFKEKVVIVDTYSIPTLLAKPI